MLGLGTLEVESFPGLFPGFALLPLRLGDDGRSGPTWQKRGRRHLNCGRQAA